MLTTYADHESILASRQAGARGYLTKDAGRHEIAVALRAAAAGTAVLDAAVQARLLAAATATPSAPEASVPLPDGLTPREGEVLALIARSLSNAQIASELVVSEATIKTHINHIFVRLTCANARRRCTTPTNTALAPSRPSSCGRQANNPLTPTAVGIPTRDRSGWSRGRAVEHEEGGMTGAASINRNAPSTVILRPISAEAAAAVLADTHPPNVRVADDYPTEFSKGIVQQVAAGSPLGPYYIHRAIDGVVIGEIGGGLVAAGVAEIGYAIVPSCWGRGHATDAVRLLIQAARQTGTINCLIAHTPLNRPASGRVVAKAGLRPIGETDDEHDGATIRVIRWELAIAAAPVTD